MKSFTPNLEELPETQKAIWSKLGWNENQRGGDVTAEPL